MSARRGATDLSGILAVDKPGGMTSHDVVDRVRRLTGERRVGHAGTLDPMATGLLVVLVGPATRLAPYLTSAAKSYEARIVFGTQTDTDDAEGRIIASAPVPDEVADPFFATGTVASLVGTHEQVPPAYSAIKRDGKVAYREARNGQALELEPRNVEVAKARLVGMECVGEYAWDVEFEVSKGTYIRSLARDLGFALGSVAHLGALRRTRSGSIDVAGAHMLEEIEFSENPAELFCDPLNALDLPVIEVADEGALRVGVGAALDAEISGASDIGPGTSVGVLHDGSLLGVYARSGDVLKAQVIIPGGVRTAR